MSKIKKETILQIWGHAENYQTSPFKQKIQACSELLHKALDFYISFDRP
jgi:hypothetical protein